MAYNQVVKFGARKRDQTLSDDMFGAIKRFKKVDLEGIEPRTLNSACWVLQ